ncbi:FKBP-type peptidyl-prolyl cis-trans isomerase N-terminal domain-containing protein [Klebsiella aerogenes]|uniref:FKBP-type peptidyl-prolyl cis-trans isomerase N-terminal domain-containing protein n=1 Tax=Klebsiella aerogenes TaxID=548 RepID=UPI0034D2C8BA
MNRFHTDPAGTPFRHPSRFSSPRRLLTGLCPLALALLATLSPGAQAGEAGLAAVTSQAAPDNGVPAILEYASTPEGQAQEQTAPSHHAGTGWQTQKDETIRKLRDALAAEKARHADTSQQQALAAKLTAAQQQLATAQQQLAGAQQQRDAAQQQLQDENQRINALEAQVKTGQTDTSQQQALAAKLTAAQQQLATAQQQLKAQTQQLADRQALADKVTSLEQDARQTADSLKAKTDALADLTAQVTDLKQHQAAAKAPPDLSSPAAQEAYSVGVSLGNDAVQEITTRQKQGVSMDRAAVLNGIEDTFAGKYRLDETARAKALNEATQAVYKNLHDQEVKELAKGVKYQKTFAKKKGVVKADGVYSLVDYAGQEKLTPDETVTVVMKESLTDGTVVSDMEAAGRQWTATLKNYPPVFRGPLSRLGNHGSITIVVPADKAYGSKGRPPAIPPGATMVYNVRVVDARAPGAAG